MAKTSTGFVSAASLKRRPSSAAEILGQIRQIYFTTTRKTIAGDLAHALELLKSLDREEDRERATVYMHGLAEMHKDWTPKRPKRK